MDGAIARLADLLSGATVVPDGEASDLVTLGATVEVTYLSRGRRATYRPTVVASAIPTVGPFRRGRACGERASVVAPATSSRHVSPGPDRAVADPGDQCSPGEASWASNRTESTLSRYRAVGYIEPGTVELQTIDSPKLEAQDGPGVHPPTSGARRRTA